MLSMHATHNKKTLTGRKQERNIMKNVNLVVSPDGKKLTVEIDLTSDFGKSKSGKSNTVASTEGAHTLPNGVKLNINCYK